MDFGKVADREIPYIDFTLPNDGESVQQTLTGNPEATKIYVGCPSWGRKEWLGLLYPPRTKEANFLDEYAKQFNSIELNAVFYSIPPASLISNWYDKVNQPGFLFFPKVSRIITHIKKLSGIDLPLAMFIESISELKEHLGPMLIQVGDNFPTKSFHILERFVESLPKEYKYVLELRNENWFQDRNDALALFKTNEIGWVITDSSGRRDVLHMELTVPEVYIRFIGNGSEHRQSDYNRIDEWVERLKQWKDKGLKQVYFIIHQHDGKDTPILADYTIKQFNKHLNAGIPLLKFIN